MADFKQIKIERCSTGGGFYVECDGRFADGLFSEEVLGVVASALFSPHGPMMLRTYQEEAGLPFTEAHRNAHPEQKLLPAPFTRAELEAKLKYQTERADANWRALCELRGGL